MTSNSNSIDSNKELESDLSLSDLLDQLIYKTQQIIDQPSPNDQSVQNDITTTLSSLHLSSSLIQHLAILSPNETLEDLNTRDLRCLLVPTLSGQLQVLVKTSGGKQRGEWLLKAQENFNKYVELIDQYEVIPEQERKFFVGPKKGTQDPSRRRDAKIAQFKMERDVKNKLETLRTQRRSRRPKISSNTSSTPLSQPSVSSFDDAYSSSDESDTLRPLYLTLLKLHYLRSFTELSSIEMELELLEGMMRMSEIPDERERKVGGGGKKREGEEEDGTWKLDEVRDKGKEGPLLSPEGKILRPFTILPSTSGLSSSGLSTRLRFSSSVFGPSHNLPTMTIDEYLDQERERGNILQGGGPSTSRAVEEEREMERGGEEEDNVGGWEKEESGLRKKREEDDWKDTHRKGEGNMHNRG